MVYMKTDSFGKAKVRQPTRVLNSTIAEKIHVPTFSIKGKEKLALKLKSVCKSQFPK